MQLNVALFRLAFASAPWLNHLTLLHTVTRRPVLQKVRGRYKSLPPFVNIWFQVLFHSPPGVLFTFPSQYYSLSVTRSYLALGDGPPTFTPNSSCSVLLWKLLVVMQMFHIQDFYLLWFAFPNKFYYIYIFNFVVVPNPNHIAIIGLGSSPFARHYLGNR